MSGIIHGLSWFPNFPDRFVSWGQEINLYEVRSSKDDGATPKSRLPYISVNYLSNESRYQYARCVAASYHSDQPIIAVGLGDGKIGICNFRDSYDSSWEYTPRQQRMCTCLAWNEQSANILAIGHDRHRSDSCITIWDIERGVPKDTANFFGLAESANSVCWDRNQRLLIAGMSQKMIKLFDLRQNNASCQSIQTKTVHGLAVAPNGHYLCSYVDSIVMLWDLRAIDRPLRQIQSSKNHLQIAWCPTRPSLLSSLQRDSPYITLYDIRSVDNENSREIYHVKRQISPFPAKYQQTKFSNLNSLSWHTRDVERALLLADAMNIMDFRLPASLHTAYSNRTKLPFLMPPPPMAACSSPTTTTTTTTTTATAAPTIGTNSSGSSLDYTGGTSSAFNFDILEPELMKLDLEDKIRQRAIEDYGMKPDNRAFAELHLSPYLRNVWSTLKNVYCDDRLTSLKSTLGINLGHTSEALMASSRIESQILQWPDGINNSNKLTCYRSEQRHLALQLCGWPHDQELERFIDQLFANKEFSRAAMICVFHLKILYACNILSSAADTMSDPSMYRITVIALSSFNADRCSTTWRNQRSNANMQIQDPHLRAIFSFLTMEKDNFEGVLKEEGVSLADRMAFACKYLSETKLADYVKNQIQKAIECGDLNGLLLTGESLDGIDILQAYMDASFDAQTVALVVINYFRHEHFSDNRIFKQDKTKLIMAFNNQQRGRPAFQQQQQQPLFNGGNNNNRRPRSRDARRMANFNQQQFDRQYGSTNWSGQMELEDRSQQALQQAVAPQRNRSNNWKPKQPVRRGPPAAPVVTAETPPVDEISYAGSGRGSKPVKKTLAQNFDCAGFIPLVRQVYERMYVEDSRLPRSLPFPIFQHAMTEFLTAYMIHQGKFILKIPALQSLMDPLAAISAESYNIPKPIFDYICGIGPNVTPTGDKVYWNYPSVAIPRVSETVRRQVVRSGHFGIASTASHNVYECYVSPYITSQYIIASRANTVGSWNPLPDAWIPAGGMPTENLLGYRELARHHPDSLRKLEECAFEDSASATGLLCHSAYVMDLSSSIIGTLSKVKSVKAVFTARENSAAFIFKNHTTQSQATATLWDEPATLNSPYAFSSAASNRANYMAYKRIRIEQVPGTCYILSNSDPPNGWVGTRNHNFQCTGQFALQRGYRDRESIRSADHEEEEGLGTVTQDVSNWLDTAMITK